MNLKFASILLFIFLVYTGCSNSQGVQLAKSDAYISAQLATELTKASIEQANGLFEAYSDESAQAIDLYLLDSPDQLEYNPSSELKDGPEGYLLLPPGLTSADTSLILEAYKKRLGETKFLSLDSLGNVLYYETGKRAPRHNFKKTISVLPVDSLESILKRTNSNYSERQSYVTEIVPEALSLIHI